MININKSKNDSSLYKELTSKNIAKNSKLTNAYNSENNKKLIAKITQKITPVNTEKKSLDEKKISYNKNSKDVEQYNSVKSQKRFSLNEENLIERHMRIIKEDAKFLTEEGDLLTNLKGIGPDNDIQMDEYVKSLDYIINKKLTLYLDLKKKMDLCNRTGKRK